MRGGQDWSESIGPLLVRTRHQLGISQLRLAERICASAGVDTVTRNEVSRWEREERIPSGYWLGWLAFALELPVSTLERAAGIARRRRHADAATFWVETTAGVFVRVAS